MSAAQKFDATAPCVICGTCAGWMNEDWINCASDLFSGGLETVAWKGRALYPHRRKGSCGCGEAHGSPALPATARSGALEPALRQTNGAESRTPTPLAPLGNQDDAAGSKSSTGLAVTKEGNTLKAAFAASSVARFAGKPAPREWLVDGLIPVRQTGLLVAAGGTGKGHWIQQLGCAGATALPLGPFRVPRKFGVLYLSLEDDADELHQRFDAAKSAYWPSGVREQEQADVERYFHQVDLVGLGARMGPELLELIAAKVAAIPDCALVIIDPMTLAAPEMSEGFNDQKAAQRIHGALNEIRHRCGVSVMCAHHSPKGADPMDANAATGTRQFVDLSRFVINMSALTPEKVSERGLDHHEQYVELATSKINSAAKMAESAVWRRAHGGGLVYTPTRRRSEVAAEKALAVLREVGPATRKVWAAACSEAGMGRDTFRSAIRILTDSGQAQRTAGERGCKATSDLFAVRMNDGGRNGGG